MSDLSAQRVCFEVAKKSFHLNPIALRKAKIVYSFGLSERNRINS